MTASYVGSTHTIHLKREKTSLVKVYPPKPSLPLQNPLPYSPSSSEEFPLDSSHDHILLLLVDKFPNVIRPTTTILLQFIHVIVYQSEFLGSFVELSLHIFPVAFLRPGSGGAAWARGLFCGGFVGAGLGYHSF